MKDSAEIVIVGGGAIGASIAYHLTRLGKRDVMIIEKSGITHGSTWHAAGLVGQLRAQRNLTRMLQQSVELYDRLEAETGQATDWKKVGSLRLASSPERWQEIKRTATTARSFGFELHLITPAEAHELFPLISLDGVIGAAWIPSDGYADPSSLTQALARGARKGGAVFHEGVQVTDITVADRRATGVVTDHGTVRADVVVNAAGIWARQVGAMAGVSVPAGAVEHQYVVTEKIAGVTPGLPTLRDPDNNFYLKPEVGGLALGGWEPDSVIFGEDGIPFSFGRELLPSNFDRFEQIAASATTRLPVLAEVGVRNLINGPIPVSADGEPVMGLAPELDNFFVACGFTAGIAACGGAGRAMAQWIVEGHPGMDLWAFDIRRFGPHHSARRFLSERCIESYGDYYRLRPPGGEARSGRRARCSPLYPLLRERGAVYGSKFGWERPNWFAPQAAAPAERPSFDKPNWFDAVAEEHRAVRERVALMDFSSFAKFEITGSGAYRLLQRLAANDLNRPPGTIVYTQLCNGRGGVECDLSVTRLAEDRFYIVTGSGFGVHDGHWIATHLPRDGTAALREVTSERAVINVCGPHSRELLARACDDDPSDAVLAYMHARELRVGYAPVRALRVSYTGELGYELHTPMEYAGHVYETLWEAGRDLGVTNVGYRAIEGLRLEKRYLYWSADITPDYTPYHAGLGFCVALDKHDFIGRDALLAVREQGPKEKLCYLSVEGYAPFFGGEAILREGRVVGVTSSAGYGHTVKRSIVLGYVPAEEATHTDYEVEAFGERFPAVRHARPLYDPDRTRLLG
jgi:sarcosine dehydrogenase